MLKMFLQEEHLCFYISSFLKLQRVSPDGRVLDCCSALAPVGHRNKVFEVINRYRISEDRNLHSYIHLPPVLPHVNPPPPHHNASVGLNTVIKRPWFILFAEVMRVHCDAQTAGVIISQLSIISDRWSTATNPHTHHHHHPPIVTSVITIIISLSVFSLMMWG